MKNRRFSMKATVIFISAITKKNSFTSIFISETNIIKLVKRKHSRVCNVIAYIIKTTILQSRKNQNVFIRHRSLFRNKTYVFELFIRINLTIENFIIAINAIINFN